MASTQLTPRPRTIKKHEKPRPLKINQRHSTNDGRITTVEDLVSLIDNVTSNLTNGFHDPSLQQNIITMCNTLKQCAHQFEAVYKDQLDRAFVAIRNGSQDDRLDLTTRIHLLELIELRAKQWRHNDSMEAYYASKLANIDDPDVHSLEPISTPTLGTPLVGLTSIQSTPVLGAGEVIKNSGKFPKPTRIPGKNYCKDEVVIRNSDSGKVNPGAKERLVQITGTSEDKIHYAKDLIKETIQRNASPVRLGQTGVEKEGSSSSLNSSESDEINRLHHHHHHQQTSHLRSTLLHSLSTNDASIGEYKHTVNVGNHSLKITGCNLNLVRTAKLVLDEHFSRYTGDFDQFTSGIEYFGFAEEEPTFFTQTQITPTTLQDQNLSGNVIKRETSIESNTTSESEETFKSIIKPKTEDVNSSRNKTKGDRELTYEFLLLCAKGPYAKRIPANWGRIQKECPNIVRKSLIRWFDPDVYAASVAAAGTVAVLPFGEIDNVLE
ncbi:hypothetical protein PV327_006094 [Microctonus hyperodae]|uniref:Eukaryotic translation initiation factor 4E-binding protein Mextli n=1 Tax=Microctonus hyperodae TaxID=165561 RepID=A0AA39G488_MICHY|nr:hypothetical protein PV327_006094 [Microctonus hyperodae]